MALSSELLAELDELLWAYRAGTATREQLTRLERLVCENADARVFFVRYVHLCADLAWNMKGEDDRLAVASDQGDAIADAAGEPQPVLSPSLDMASAVGGELKRQPSRSIHTTAVHRAAAVVFSKTPWNEYVVGGVISAVVMLILGFGLWMWKISDARMVPAVRSAVASRLDVRLDENAVQGGAEKSASPSLVKPVFVGRITGQFDCQWKLTGGKVGSGQWAVGSAKPQAVFSKSLNPQIPKSPNSQSPISNPPSLVAFGDKFAIASGLLEITFDSGAKVLLEGPCTFNVEKNGGFLAVGRLTGRIDKTGRLGEEETRSVTGQALSPMHKSESPRLPISPSPRLASSTATPTAFVIATPTAIITDLGTEFGVEVERNGRTVSHVFRGSIEMQVASAFASNTDAASLTKKLLQKNESACVEIKKDFQGRNGRASLHSVAVNPSVFTRLLPSDFENYVELVHSLKPVAYYRMERPKDARDALVVTDCVGGHHGVLHLGDKSRNPWKKGIVGGSLAFDGATYVDVPTLPAAENNELSVAAWVWASDHSDWANIASEQYAAAWDGPRRMQFGFGLLGADGDLWAGVNAGDGRWCHVRQGAQSPVLFDCWTHVAFVADGKNLRLYRGGAQVACIPCDGVCHTPPIKHLMIGCKNWSQSVDSPKVKPVQFWEGRIDELAVFNHALSPSEVRRLCRCGLREVQSKSHPEQGKKAF